MLLRFGSGEGGCVIRDVYYKELQENNIPNCPFNNKTLYINKLFNSYINNNKTLHINKLFYTL